MACLSLLHDSASVTLRGGLILLIVTAWGTVGYPFGCPCSRPWRGSTVRRNTRTYGASFRYSSLGLIFLLQALMALLISSIFYPIASSQTPWRLIDTILINTALFGLLGRSDRRSTVECFCTAFAPSGPTPNPGFVAARGNTHVIQTILANGSLAESFPVGVKLPGNWIGMLSIALVSWLLLRFTGVATHGTTHALTAPRVMRLPAPDAGLYTGKLFQSRWFRRV